METDDIRLARLNSFVRMVLFPAPVTSSQNPPPGPASSVYTAKLDTAVVETTGSYATEIGTLFYTDFITDVDDDILNTFPTDIGSGIQETGTINPLSNEQTAFFISDSSNISITPPNGTSLGTTSTVVSTVYIDTVTAEIVSRVATACLMSLFLFVTLVGNVIVLFVFKHRYRKFTARVIFMYNFIVILFCDGLCNMSIAWGAVLAGVWPYGQVICQFSSFLLNTFNTLTLFALLHLTFDRFLAMKKPDWYHKNVQIVASLVVILITWLYTIAFNLAIFAGAVPSNYYINRFICGISSGVDLIFTVLRLVLNLLVPLSAVSFFFIVIAKMATVSKGSVQELPEDEVFLRKPKLVSVVKHTKLIAILIIFWCILEGPYQVVHTVYLFSKGEPDVLISFSVETITTWMKFLYPAIVPIFILVGMIGNRKVQKLAPEHLDMVTPDESASRSPRNEPGVRTSWASEASERTLTSPTTSPRRHFQVPVLFPTAEGLRMRVGNDSGEIPPRQRHLSFTTGGEKFVKNKPRQDDKRILRSSSFPIPNGGTSLPDLRTLTETEATRNANRGDNYELGESVYGSTETLSSYEYDNKEQILMFSGNEHSLFGLSLSKNTETFVEMEFQLPATPIS